MRNVAGLLLACVVIGCGPSGTSDAVLVEEVSTEPVSTDQGFAPLEFKQVDDNLKHDTLLIQVTFDLGDGSFVMVASNVAETFEGVRLYRYKLKTDGTADMMAASSPGYDSWTMLPSFFPYPNPPGTYMILANFGERESWGQKLIFMDKAFTDLGFLDVAYPEHVVEGDSAYVKRTNVAPYGRFEMHIDTLVFTFECDSLFLYDDMAGHNDLIVPAHSIRYTCHPKTGLVLWQNGQSREVKQPS